jgi:hypothetical protein
VGSIHLPDGGDWSQHMPQLLSVVERAQQPPATPPVWVVFHCMESIRRGPRCARRLFQALNMAGNGVDAAAPITIKVLQGGADQWMRNFYSDPRLVEAYNNDIWGYLDD